MAVTDTTLPPEFRAAVDDLDQLAGRFSIMASGHSIPTIRERAFRIEMALRAAAMLANVAADETQHNRYIASKLNNAVNGIGLQVLG